MSGQWVVLLRTGVGAAGVHPFGPFDDDAVAQCFADYLTAEVDPAVVVSLRSPVAELLSFWGRYRENAEPSLGRPDHWPPMPGHVWEDRNRDRWICGRVPSGAPYLFCIAKQADDSAEEIWRTHGPLRHIDHVQPNGEEPPF